MENLDQRLRGGIAITSLFNKSSTYYNGRAEETASIEKQNYILPQSSFFGYYAAAGLDMSVNKKQFVFVRIVYDNAKKNGDQLKTIQLRFGYGF